MLRLVKRTTEMIEDVTHVNSTRLRRIDKDKHDRYEVIRVKFKLIKTSLN